MIITKRSNSNRRKPISDHNNKRLRVMHEAVTCSISNMFSSSRENLKSKHRSWLKVRNSEKQKHRYGSILNVKSQKIKRFLCYRSNHIPSMHNMGVETKDVCEDEGVSYGTKRERLIHFLISLNSYEY